MSVLPSMVHRSGDTLVVRSVVSGDPLYEDVAVPSYASTPITGGATTDKLVFYTGHHHRKRVEEDDDDLPPRKDTTDLPECKVKRNYSCATCDYFTQNPRKYLYHLRDVHREKVKVYECPSCLYASKHYQKLLRHTRMVHGRNATVTPDKRNAKISSNAITATSHSRRKRGGGIGAVVVVKEESFSGCDEALQTSPRPVDDEEQDGGEGEEDEAAEEDDQSNDVDELLHVTVQGGGRGGGADAGHVKFRCALCSYVAKGQQQLTKHESEVHIRTKFFRCTKCSYVTHIKARYTKHVKYHSMPMIKCDLCDFRTPYKWNLDRHCKNHNGRGAFRCSACNFTADIKQSLTVHEMNHHVPPVGQAAIAAAAAAAAAAGTITATTTSCATGAAGGAPVAAVTVAVAGVAVSTSRRRNKVGASDSICAAENQVEDYHQGKQQRTSQKNPTDLLSYRNTSSITTTTAAAYTSADFVHPDDIVERPNGHIYLKSQCKLCNFKTAYDAEMVKHERTHHSATATFPHHHHHRHHSISTAASCKPRRTPRPVPNLIPIRSPPNMLSAKELHDITIGSSNSALKDYAPLFDSEELFRPQQQQQALQPVDPNFKEKNASFFDKLKEKLLSHDSSTELICQRCGHESKCWTESVSHLKMCGKEMTGDRLADNGTPPLHNNNNISSVLSSTRCQYCRQRCKSSADLYVHMQTCTKYQQESELFGDEEEDEEAEHMEIEMRPEDILSVEEQQHDSGDSQHQQPHPMENRVFVWNDIEVPMNIGMDDVDLHQHQHQLIPQQQHHHQQHQPQQADFNAYYHLMENAMKQNALVDDDDVDAVSLDLSIRTQSPVSEATPPHPTTKPTKQSQTGQNSTNMFGKVPTHGNDISIAQHKRVFKCPHCSFWASTASRFHVHIVGHLNKKPFECSLCAYRSNWRWDITKHIKLKSVRDPNHETARVLMTDETGRRNYTKYNKYLTEINMPNGSGADAAAPTAANVSLPSRGKHQHVDDSTSLAIAGDGKHHNKRPPPDLRAANSDCITVARFAAALSAQSTRATLSGERDGGKKRALGVESTGPVSGYTGESRRPMYKCAKYISKDRSQEKRVETTETHYTAQTLLSLNNNNDDSCAVDITCQPDMQQLLLPAVLPRAASGTITPSSDGSCDTSMDMRLSSPSQHDDSMAGGGGVGDQMTTPAAAARGGSAPFSCGHCHQRHCRLKHHGDISVIVGGRAGHPDRVESDRQPDEPEHMDMPQLGAHKCPHCPYSTDVDAELAAHAVGHIAAVTAETTAGEAAASSPRCPICDYTVAHLAEIYAHLPLHGIGDPVEYMQRVSESDPSKRHKCTACPYVTNSKSQYMYHKRFHKPKNGQYKCSKCNYNVSRRHLLHQHMKVHSVGKAEYIDLEEYEELTDSGAEMPLSVSEQPLSPPPLSSSSPRTRTHSTNSCGGSGTAAAISADIPLIWVSRGGNFSKMYKCRHCPHVNSRKVNIQEHEKMHAASSGNAADSGSGGVVAAVKVEGEHHCAQCDYVCNNAGVLSSHIKVHQGAFGILHCLVDPQKSDEDQIRTLTISLHQMPKYQQQQQHLLAAAGLMIPPPPPPLTSADAAVEEDEVLEPPTDVNLAASLAESGDMLYFCHECPARFLKAKEFEIHRKLHGGRLFYKCNYCTYTGRQRPHLNAHAVVHTTEYKKRTANLRSIYRTHPVHTAPALSLVYPDSDHWVVAKSPAGDVNTTATSAASATTSDTISVELDSDTDINDNNIHDVDTTTTNPSIALTNTLLSATRNTLTSSKDHHGVVPLSGTDLFRHRQMAVDAAAAESRKKLADNSSRAAQMKDNSRLAGVEDVDATAPDQFGAGNPVFIYPMCTKNGRQKEKRYKCAKCPTAFEKREQYKIHLGLHGSKQRFQCDECDYSVANSSNFVQHQRKHIAHTSAVVAAKTTTAAAKTSVAASSVQQQQQQVFRCPNCPYNSRRRDAVDNHLRRHASVSGVRQAHGCAHCDYSVAQAHILRDHVKMHFAATEAARPLADAFLSPDVAVKVRVAEATERVLFDDNNADEDDDDDDEADNSDTVVGGDCDSNGTKDNNGNTGTTVE